MALRELDERIGDNLRVTLYWQEEDDTLVVEVEDFRDADAGLTLTGIPAEDAREAFQHPYAYRKAVAA